MAQINLTEDEKIQIIEAINQGLEPSADLLPKIFPRTAEKFDVVALDRAKIPTLEYAGKRTKAAILAEGAAGIGAAPLQVVRCFGDSPENNWRNLLVQGDNLQFLKTCYKNTEPLIKDKIKGKVKLIYIDPPFATKSDFGGKEGEYSYADKVERAQFIETLRERLIYFEEILSDDGSLYVHLDQRMSHYVKVVIDEVFGKDNFVNEIIWQGAIGDTSAKNKKYIKSHDTIFFYRKSNKDPIWNDVFQNYSETSKNLYKNKDEKGYYQLIAVDNPGGGGYSYDLGLGEKKPKNGYRMPYETAIRWLNEGILLVKGGSVPRRKQYIGEGVRCRDVWTDLSSLQGIENLGYPTQKPESILERIITSSTKQGDLVIDCFAGSGTTAAVAEKLGRRWIACDFGKHAIYTMQKRILRIAESKKLSSEKKKDEKYGLDPKPFCVVSSGAYDFTHIMDMRKNKDSYIDFALGLFQLTRDDEKAAKFKIPNIYGVKENNPVEVYPVWDDSYLKDIRIDEIYLQGILAHTGGRLRGDYYIITPESCTNISDTVMKNQEGKEVNFKILTFPYKILEDISQKLKLEDQPSSAADINNLITSTSFYFNEDVGLKVERVKEGLRITKFDTKILDGEGNRFEGLSGLAMILVDLDFQPGKPFDMDLAIYAKEIGEDGLCKIDKLTEKVGVIAIDKHGNESKPLEVK